MSDPLMMLAIVAVAVTSLTVVLARLIPDDYDRFKPAPSRVKVGETR
jgi:hypothetical protein